MTGHDPHDVPWIPASLVDDHVIEPPHVWQRWLPGRFRDRGPEVVRDSYSVEWVDGNQVFRKGGDGPDHRLVGLRRPRAWCHQMLNVCAGYDESRVVDGPDRLRPDASGLLRRAALASPTWTSTTSQASLCFPTFPRFCGQVFAERADQDLALACVRAYNDWMVEEWAGDSGGRSGSAVHRAALGPAPRRRRGASQRRRAVYTRSPSPSCRAGWGCRRSTIRVHWEPFFRGLRRDGDRDLHAHRLRLALAHVVARRAAGGHRTLVFITSAMALTDWLLSGRPRAPRRPADLLRRGPDRLDPVCARTSRQHLGQGGVGLGRQLARSAEPLHAAGLRVLLRRPTGLRARDAIGVDRSPSRRTIRTRTPPGRTRSTRSGPLPTSSRAANSKRSSGATPPSSCTLQTRPVAERPTA